MPNTMIETRAGWIDDPSAVIEAVQAALREALRLPEWDRTLRLIEHPASHFAVPPENWGIRGGQPASEVDLGFEIKV